MFIFNSKPNVVFARAGKRFHNSEDFATIMLGFPDQKVAIIASNWITRNQLKSREIKASRTKVTILWTIDNHEIRGDKTIIRELLESKLRDYIAEVEIQDSDNYIPTSLNNIIIACSKFDHTKIIDRMNKNINQHHPNYKIVVISANSTFDTIEI